MAATHMADVSWKMLELRARSKRSGLTSWLAREELRGSLCLPALTAPLPHSLPRSRPGPGLFPVPTAGSGARAGPALRGAGDTQGWRPCPSPRRAEPPVPSGVTCATGAKAACSAPQLCNVLRLWSR